jgi:prohead serine protease
MTHGTVPALVRGLERLPIGSIEDLHEDARGLYVRARLFNNYLTEPLRDAISAHAIRGMSFRFLVVPDHYGPPLPTGGARAQRSRCSQRRIRRAHLDLQRPDPTMAPDVAVVQTLWMTSRRRLPSADEETQQTRYERLVESSRGARRPFNRTTQPRARVSLVEARWKSRPYRAVQKAPCAVGMSLDDVATDEERRVRL